MKKLFFGAWLIALLIGTAFVWANTVEQVALKSNDAPLTNYQYYDASDLTSINVPADFVKHQTPTDIKLTRTAKTAPVSEKEAFYVANASKNIQAATRKANGFVPYDPGTILDAPANDECSNCESITTYPSTVTGTVVEATVDCPGLFTEDFTLVWYCVNAPNLFNNIYVDFCPTWEDLGGDIWTIFPYIFSDCACEAGNVIAYSTFEWNVDCNYQPKYDFLNLPGPATYYLPVYTLDADDLPMAFKFDIDVQQCSVLPQGDACDNPFIVPSLPYTDNVHNTADFANDYNYGGPDVVYELTLTECMVVTISLCNTDPVFDTYLWLYPGDDCGGTPIATDDDFCTSPDYGTSQITMTLGPCTYYIVVDAYTGYSGPYVLDITGVASPVPANDECASAINVGTTFPVTVSGTTIGAGIDCPGPLDWNGVWYTFDAPYEFNDVSISFCLSEVDLPNVGIILMDDCNCDDYIIADAAAFVTCENETTNPEMSFYGIPGPATYYYIAYVGCVPVDFSFEINVREQHELVCPPTARHEGEEICYDGYDDAYNSGCNYAGAPAPTVAIADGDTICGNAGIHLDSSGDPIIDTDWYRFDLGAELRTFEWTGVANFPLQLLIIDAYEDCSQTPILAAGTADACETLTVSVTGTGVYYLWASSQNVINVDCAIGIYVAWLHVFQPPENNSCADAIEIGEISDYAWTNLGATTDNNGACDPALRADVWYRYNSSRDCMVVVDLYGSNFDTFLGIFTDDCVDHTCIAYDDDYYGGGSASKVTFSATQGQSYLICCGGWNGNMGYGNMTISYAPIIQVTPDSINMEIYQGGSKDTTLTISNIGGGILQFECLPEQYFEDESLSTIGCRNFISDKDSYFASSDIIIDSTNKTRIAPIPDIVGFNPFTDQKDCVIECPPGATVEDEACGDNGNNGCFSNPFAADTIHPDEVIWGTCWADSDQFDIDCYYFQLDKEYYAKLEIKAEFPCQTYLFSFEDCNSQSLLKAKAEYDICIDSKIKMGLSAGGYVLYVKPFGDTDIKCDGSTYYGSKYELSFKLTEKYLSLDVAAGYAPPDFTLRASVDARFLEIGFFRASIWLNSTDPLRPNERIPLKFQISSGLQFFNYLPGDANMYNGQWPPNVIGGDVTYLVNFFRNLPANPFCKLDGLYCAADVNGDCRVIGSDVTRLVNFFRGLGTIEPCPDYPPAWLTPADYPVEAPSGWPNCEEPALNSRALPTMKNK